MSDFKLGPIQLGWIQKLKDNPDLQLECGGYLGAISSDGDGVMQFCCLGLGLVHLCEVQGKEIPLWEKPNHVNTSIKNVFLFDGDDKDNPNVRNYGYLQESFSELGLKDEKGSVIGVFEHIPHGYWESGEVHTHSSLAAANDSNVPWSFLAEYIEQHPEHFFVKSV